MVHSGVFFMLFCAVSWLGEAKHWDRRANKRSGGLHNRFPTQERKLTFAISSAEELLVTVEDGQCIEVNNGHKTRNYRVQRQIALVKVLELEQ